MVSVGPARIRRVRIRRPRHTGLEEFPEHGTLKVGRKRNGSPHKRKLECYKKTLDSFLQKVGYPFREDSPLKVECVKEAPPNKVTLEAPDKSRPLWLCKNHYEWVKERESKLGELNVRVR